MNIQHSVIRTGDAVGISMELLALLVKVGRPSQPVALELIMLGTKDETRRQLQWYREQNTVVSALGGPNH